MIDFLVKFLLGTALILAFALLLLVSTMSCSSAPQQTYPDAGTYCVEGRAACIAAANSAYSDFVWIARRVECAVWQGTCIREEDAGCQLCGLYELEGICQTACTLDGGP